MRIFSMFMVVLVLGLSMAPCCTPVIGNSTDQNKLVDAGSDCCKSDCQKENEDAAYPLPSDNTCGVCSPFYTCGSCTGYTLQNTEYTNFIVNTDSKEYALIEFRFDSEYFNLKWQPPKLSSFFS